MILNGWWQQATRLDSPNYNDRPEGCPVSLLVIHNISLPPAQYGGGFVQKFFLNQLDSSFHPYFESIQNLQVSAHCFIERDGKATQFVSFLKRAWHAGRSTFQGRENCNDFAIGIELEGTDDEPYTESQYECLVALTILLMSEYPEIKLEHIVGHNDIAPDRKTDPGPAFDWQKYKKQVEAQLAGES